MLSRLWKRKALLGALLLGIMVNAAIIGGLAWKRRKDRKRFNEEVAALTQKTAALTKKTTFDRAFDLVPAPLAVNWKSFELPKETRATFEAAEQSARDKLRSLLDLGPEKWKMDEVLAFKEPAKTLNFTADKMPVPSTDAVERWTKDNPVLRPMPYPFFRALSIPWDPDNSEDADIFYSNMLLSRKYGLDFPCGFWPYTCYDRHPSFSLFCGSSREPRLYPVRHLEGATTDLDAFPFFLTCYFRGWTDHIHSWSSECSYPHSLLLSQSVTVTEEGSAQTALTTQKGPHDHCWRGFEVKLAVGEDVSAFELRLNESDDLVHWVVFNKPLAGRPGWDVSHLSRQELRCFYLPVHQEKNRPWSSDFGLTRKDKVLDSASLAVEGKTGATLSFEALRVYDLDRETIQDQMARMKQWNILPPVTTAHGGYTGWALPRHKDIDNYPITMGGATSLRRALGSTPGSPAYCSDLLAKFGLIHLNRIGDVEKSPRSRATGNFVMVDELPDGGRYYESVRSHLTTKHLGIPAASDNNELTENTGTHLCRFLLEDCAFGVMDCLYMHNNIFSKSVVSRPADGTPHVPMRELKAFNPPTAETFEILANCQYNLDAQRQTHQRVWCVPVSVACRYAQGLRHLKDHVEVKGNDVRITPVKDRVTGQDFPDPAFLTQDLHGQTFYVPDASQAKVFCNDVAITSLMRNPPDFTGRSSVTIVDTSAPTKVFDEVDFFEQNGRLFQQDALAFFQSKHAYSGQYALEVQATGKKPATVTWQPFLLHAHETQYLRFAFKKTNPQAQIVLGWSDGDTPKFVATDGELKGLQGWKIPSHQDSDWHEVVLDFAEMTKGSGSKSIPRGPVKTVWFGIENAQPGDAVYFDCVEFLAARGVRPHAGDGFVIGGRLHPPLDNKIVSMRDQHGRTRQAVTMRGGWYYFKGVPRDALVEITAQDKGIDFYPVRGRVFHVCKNDVEVHLYTTDARSNSLPRVAFNRPAGEEHTMSVKTASPAWREKTNALCEPHAELKYGGPPEQLEFLVKDQVNNFGFFDRDRRLENPDKALRICVLGDCLVENVQSQRNHHLNLYLESFLRRRTGLNVEVMVAASPNASPGSNAPSFDKVGRHFQPHLVVHMVWPPTLVQMEPTLQQLRWGWVKEHAPYRMFELDKRGKLINYPPDPDYSIHMVKVEPQVLLEDVPLEESFYLMNKTLPQMTARSFQLLQAILEEQYLGHMRKSGGSMFVVTGHYFQSHPKYNLQSDKNSFARERWVDELTQSCGQIGVPVLDLAPLMKRNGAEEAAFTWAGDGHFTPTGNYQAARCLAEKLLEQPEIQQLVDRVRQEQRNSR